MRVILYMAMTVNGKIANGDFAPRLKLLGVKTLTNRQTVQLHYKVIK